MTNIKKDIHLFYKPTHLKMKKKISMKEKWKTMYGVWGIGIWGDSDKLVSKSCNKIKI